MVFGSRNLLLDARFCGLGMSRHEASLGVHQVDGVQLLFLLALGLQAAIVLGSVCALLDFGLNFGGLGLSHHHARLRILLLRSHLRLHLLHFRRRRSLSVRRGEELGRVAPANGLKGCRVDGDRIVHRRVGLLKLLQGHYLHDALTVRRSVRVGLRD